MIPIGLPYFALEMFYIFLHCLGDSFPLAMKGVLFLFFAKPRLCQNWHSRDPNQVQHTWAAFAINA